MAATTARGAYRDATWAMNDEVRAELDWFAGAAGAGGRGARDRQRPAAATRSQLEERGLSVRRTDVTPGFVELLRSRGHEADVLDPLTDDLADGRTLRRRLGERLPAARRTRGPAGRAAQPGGGHAAGGPLGMSLKEGDGEEWSTHGT